VSGQREKRLSQIACFMSRRDFDATFYSLGQVRPWMDHGQKESAHGFARLRGVFHREYGNDVAVYRCDTNRYGK
jgi:hypothetical protein